MIFWTHGTGWLSRLIRWTMDGSPRRPPDPKPIPDDQRCSEVTRAAWERIGNVGIPVQCRTCGHEWAEAAIQNPYSFEMLTRFVRKDALKCSKCGGRAHRRWSDKVPTPEALRDEI